MYQATIKDLETQIDYLIGYAPTGEHWKREYYVRQSLIDNTINDESCPPEVRDKIYRLQDSIYRLRTDKSDRIKIGMNDSVKDYLASLGKKGGNTTKAKYGKKHFSNAGKLGMARRWAGHKKAK